MNIHSTTTILLISSCGIVVSKILAGQLKLYGSGKSSTLSYLQGRYVLGFLTILAISAMSSFAITFLLGWSTILFFIIVGAFSIFGFILLTIGYSRKG